MARSDIRNTIGNLIPSGRLDNQGAANAYAITKPIKEIKDPVEAGISNGLKNLSRGISKRVANDDRDRRNQNAKDKRKVESEQLALDKINAESSYRKHMNNFKDVATRHSEDMVNLNESEFNEKHADELLGFDANQIENKVLRESYKAQIEDVKSSAFSGAQNERFSRERITRGEEYADELVNDGDPEELNEYFQLTQDAGMSEDEQWGALLASVTRQVESGNIASVAIVQEKMKTIKDLDLRKEIAREFSHFYGKSDVINYANRKQIKINFEDATTSDEIDNLVATHGLKSYTAASNKAYKRVEKIDVIDHAGTSMDVVLNKTGDVDELDMFRGREITVKGQGGTHKVTITEAMVNQRVTDFANSLRVDRENTNAIGRYHKLLTKNHELPTGITSEYSNFVAEITAYDPKVAKTEGLGFIDFVQDNYDTFVDLGDWLDKAGNVNNVARKLGIEPKSREGTVIRLYDTLRNNQNLAPEKAWEQASRMVRVNDTTVPMEKSSKYSGMLEGNGMQTGVLQDLMLNGRQKAEAIEYTDYASRSMTADAIKTQLVKMYGDQNEIVEGWRVNDFPEFSRIIGKDILKDYAEDVTPEVVIESLLETTGIIKDEYAEASFEPSTQQVIISGNFENEDGDTEKNVYTIPLYEIKTFIKEEYKDDFLTTDGLEDYNKNDVFLDSPQAAIWVR
jgi:hypothetical protein